MRRPDNRAFLRKEKTKAAKAAGEVHDMIYFFARHRASLRRPCQRRGNSIDGGSLCFAAPRHFREYFVMSELTPKA